MHVNFFIGWVITMITSNQLQLAYVDLYAQLREYIWTFDVLVLIGNLEIEIFNRFPNISKVKSALDRLKVTIQSTINEDDLLKESIDNMYTILSDSDTIYADLPEVQVVVTRDSEV